MNEPTSERFDRLNADPSDVAVESVAGATNFAAAESPLVSDENRTPDEDATSEAAGAGNALFPEASSTGVIAADAGPAKPLVMTSAIGTTRTPRDRRSERDMATCLRMMGRSQRAPPARP